MTIRCGSCKDRHASVQAVRECYDEMDEVRAQVAGEIEAERRNERFFEEGTEAQQMTRAAEADYEERMLGR